MRRAFLLVLTAAAFWAGAAWGAGNGGEAVFNLGADPRTIDPALNNAADGNDVISNIFDGLVRVSSRPGSEDRPEAACAESWDVSPDGMSWTFHLRKGLKWSDGAPLTAEDFRCGFLRALDPETASPYAYYAFFIKNGEAFYNGRAKAEDVGLTAVDETTFRIDLEYQNPLMLDTLSFSLFEPARRDVVEKAPRAWAAKPETLISNGPFTLESWRHGEGGAIVLAKNPHYWDADNVKVDKLRMVFISDSNTALAAFKGGRIDYLAGFPPKMVPQLLKSGQAQSLPSLGTSYCDFNMTRPPFDDARVRRAFALAIDRKAIVEKITLGGQRPGTAFVPYGIPDGAGDFREEGGAFLPERADAAEARRLLTEAGYPEGKGFPRVSYKYNSNPTNKAIAEALQGMWKQVLGVEVALLNEEWKVFLETRARGDFDIARNAWLLDFCDPASILELFVTGSPQNNIGYSRPAYDQLITGAAREMDSEKRMTMLHEAEKMLMEDLPGAPIFFHTAAVMQSPRVRGIYHSPRGCVYFRDAEIVK